VRTGKRGHQRAKKNPQGQFCLGFPWPGIGLGSSRDPVMPKEPSGTPTRSGPRDGSCDGRTCTAAGPSASPPSPARARAHPPTSPRRCVVGLVPAPLLPLLPLLLPALRLLRSCRFSRSSSLHCSRHRGRWCQGRSSHRRTSCEGEQGKGMRCRDERSARRRLPTASLPRRRRGGVVSGGKGTRRWFWKRREGQFRPWSFERTALRARGDINR
jgi:hypothetical protein